MDFDIVVSEFELKSRYYVHLQTNTFGKGMNSIIPTPSYSLNFTTTTLL